MANWVIFDADNTLWNLEPIFDAAREEMCEIVSRNSNASKSDIEKFQRAVDASLFDIYGYNPKRFPKSFEETAKKFVGEELTAALLARIHAIAELVHKTDAPPTDGIEEVLLELGASKNLGLITSGHLNTQRRRLAAFPHISVFNDNIDIVERKNIDAFRKYCNEHQIDVHRSWMVGDSLRSDILPACEVGLSAIHYSMPNWHEVEIAHHSLPLGVWQTQDMREVPNIILSNSGEQTS